MFEFIDIKFLIMAISTIGVVCGGYAVLKANVKRLDISNKDLRSKLEKYIITLSELLTEKKQFLKIKELDSRYVSIDSNKSLKELINSKFNSMENMIKELKDEIKNK